MPVYTFTCEICGQNKEIIRPMKDYAKPVFCDKDKTRMYRNFKADFGKQLHGDIWPYYSYAAGVSEGEVPEMMEFDKAHGVPTEYKDGDPLMKSPSFRKKYCEAHKLFDRNAGYGDPVPARCK